MSSWRIKPAGKIMSPEEWKEAGMPEEFVPLELPTGRGRSLKLWYVPEKLKEPIERGFSIETYEPPPDKDHEVKPRQHKVINDEGTVVIPQDQDLDHDKISDQLPPSDESEDQRQPISIGMIILAILLVIIIVVGVLRQ